MESCGVGYRLQKLGMVHIIVGPGDGGVFSSEQTWDRLRKREIWIEIRILVAAAVTRPPAGIECKPASDSLGAAFHWIR